MLIPTTRSQSLAYTHGVPGKRFSAFLSYAHEDQETVAWLHRLLCRFWVPGKPSRNVFRDVHSLPAGPLTENLRDALRNSEYLIVCCSASTPGSNYVELEISEFLSTHPPGHVLACLVGEIIPGPRILPKALVELERQRGDTLLLPDLRGWSNDMRRKQRQAFENTALALLAPLVGLKDKGVLLDRRKKARVVSAALAVIALCSFTGWKAWTYTDRYQVEAIAKDCCNSEEFTSGVFGTLSGKMVSGVAEAGRWSDADRAGRRIKERLTRASALTALAETFHRSSRNSQAESLVLAALATARSIDDARSRAEALLRLMVPLRSLGRSQEATAAVHEAFQASTAIEAPEARSFSCSRSAVALIESGQTQEARQAVAEALKAAGRITDNSFQARAYAMAVGPELATQGAAGAEPVQQQAVSAARRIGANEERAITLGQVALALAGARPLEAGRAAAEAIEAARRVDPPQLRFFVLSNVAELLAGAEPPEPSSVLPENALQAARSVGMPGLRARPLALVSAAFQRQGNAERAAEVAREAVNAAEQLEDSEERFQVLAEISEIIDQNGLSPEAGPLAERAFFLANHLPGETERPVSLMQTAVVLTLAGRQGAAHSLAERALRAAVALPDHRAVSDLQARMAGLQALWGQYRQARLTASRCRVPEDRLKAYSAILRAYVDAQRKSARDGSPR